LLDQGTFSETALVVNRFSDCVKMYGWPDSDVDAVIFSCRNMTVAMITKLLEEKRLWRRILLSEAWKSLRSETKKMKKRSKLKKKNGYYFFYNRN
jgi:hypothetical protein